MTNVSLINSEALHTLVYDFLPHAEVTDELREHVLALDYNKLVKENRFEEIVKYLTIIQALVSVRYLIKLYSLTNMLTQEFGDGGELYRSLLNRLTRHFLEHLDEHKPYVISSLEKDHDISAILAQIEGEKAAELALQQTDEIGPDSIALDALHISRDVIECSEIAGRPVAELEAAPLNQQSDSEGANSAAIRHGKVKSTLRRILNLGRKENTAVPSNKPA